MIAAIFGGVLLLLGFAACFCAVSCGMDRDRKYATVFHAVAIFCITVGLLMGSGGAFAADKTIEWIAPTECTNGDTIGATPECPALERYRFTCSHDPGPPYKDVIWFIDAPALSDQRDYPPGDYYCRLAVSNGEWSGWSNELFFSIALPLSEPLPPMITTPADSGS